MAHYYTPSGRSIQKPYSKGRDAYQEDYEDRYESGELFDENKVALVDSTPYYTHNKRVVYGGGGIKPDIYVPVDTSWYSTFYNKLLRAGTFNRFSIEYVNSQRGLLQQHYPDFETYLKKFEVDSVLWNRFLAYALDKKIEAGKDNYSQSLPSMSAQLKAMIAQYLFDSKAYYPIMNLENPIIKKALEVIDDKKTFKKLNVDH
jgi:carboxyl-terminal processing protease